MRRGLDVDVVVVGAGGAGLVASIAARDEGAQVLVVETSPLIGGTYAYSTGLIWCPASSKMLAAGFDDCRDIAAAHVRALSGGRHDDEILDAYLTELPAALDYLEQKHQVPYELVPDYPDYYAEREGGTTDGRYVASPVFDLNDLPADWASRIVTSPIYAQSPASWREIQSWGGFGTVARWDRDLIAARRERGTVGFGAASVGYLLRAALAAGVEIRTSVAVRRLLVDGDGRIGGVMIGDGGSVEEVRSAAVILASGAFDWNERLHWQLDPHRSPTAVGIPSVDGSGMIMALERGAALAVVAGQILAPTYRIPGEEMTGKPLWRLFVREPALPGGIVVNQEGRRFCDESFYRAIVHAMSDFDLTTQSYRTERAFFVFDEEWKNKYALGSVAPGELPAWLVSGSADEIAPVLGLPTDRFADTLETYNRHASDGEDPEFGRGRLLYARNNGDRDNIPNPCVRPLRGRLHAIEIHLGTLGGSSGLCIDTHGRVLDWRQERIPGLYGAGNVAANLVEGLWYNSGVANGRAIAFGRRAGRASARDGAKAIAHLDTREPTGTK